MQKSLFRILALAMGVPLLLGLLAACGSGTTGTGNSSVGSTTIKIASDFPVSGKDESGGKPAENGAHLAVDQANAANFLPGYHFVFVPKDDVGPNGTHDVATGQRNVTDLIGDALVAGMVGPLNSSVAISELPVANKAPLAIVSPANTNDCLTQNDPVSECGSGTQSKLNTYRPTGKVTYFRIATLDKFQGGKLADFTFQTKSYRRVYVIDDTETYGVGIATAFIAEWQKLGGTVINRASVAPTTTSYVNLLTQVASTNPDFIFFGGNDSTGGIAINQQMQQIPALRSTPLIAGDGVQTSAFARTIGHTGGPVYTSVASANAAALSTSQAFFAQYDAKYGANNISAYSGGSYDCAKIILQAIKTAIGKGVSTPKDSNDAVQAKVFRQAVIDAIQGVDYNGVTGHHTFDNNGDTTNKVISIYTIADDVNVGNGWKFVTQLRIS